MSQIPQQSQRFGSSSRPRVRSWVAWVARGTYPGHAWWLTDACLMGLLLVAPLILGGRHPVGKLVFSLFIGLAVVGWMVRCYATSRFAWRAARVQWLLVAACMLVTLQTVPLPADLLSRLSPRTLSLVDIPAPLATWTDAGSVWSFVSLSPISSRKGLALLLGYAMLFLLMVQRIDRLADVQWILKSVAAATVAMAAWGLLQYFFSNERFLWLYLHPSRLTSDVVKGPFANENHFAHFLALGTGPLLWWVHSHVGARSRSDAARCLGALAVGLVLFAALQTSSRGGVLMMGFAASIYYLGAWRTKALGRRQWFVAWLTVATVFVATVIDGLGPLGAQFASLDWQAWRNIPQLLGREQIWAADCRILADFPWLGTGVGSHREVYPIYFDGPRDVDYTHAESGYLQVLVETGYVGGTLLALAWGHCIVWCVRSLRFAGTLPSAGCSWALAASLMVSGVHSLWDFVWYVPACVTPTVLLAACAYRRSQILFQAESSATTAERSTTITREGEPVPRAPTRAAGTPALVIAGLAAVLAWGAITWPLVGPAFASVHWDRYLRQQVVEEDASSDAARGSSIPAEPLAAGIHHLQAGLRCDPYDGRAHARLATLALRQFELRQQHAENALPLVAIRGAVWASEFRSRQAMEDWLQLAIGVNCRQLYLALVHAQRAIALCPLHGEAYAAWSEVAFLQGGDEEVSQALLAQSLRVRPHEPATLLMAGISAMHANQLHRGLDYCSAAFNAAPELQVQLFDSLRSQLPLEMLLDHLDLDTAALRRLFPHYHSTGEGTIAQPLGELLTHRLQAMASSAEGQRAANYWHEAQGVFHDLGDDQRAATCGRRAVALAPKDLPARKALIARLVQIRCLDEAQQHLERGLLQAPHDLELKAWRRTFPRRLANAARGSPRSVRPSGKSFETSNSDASFPTSRR